jgi:zinc-ribbon domain
MSLERAEQGGAGTAVRNDIPCSRCGAVIEPGKKFCSQCGSPRGAIVSGPPAAPLNSGTDGAGALFMPAATPSLVPSAGAGAIPAHGPLTRMDMSGKSDELVWSSYWRLAWSQRPSAKVLSLLRAFFAVSAAAVQFLYLANSRPFHDEKLTVAVIIVAVYTALYSIEATWNFIFMAPVRLDEARRHQAKNHAVKIYCLQSELQEATERARPKIGFQLKSERPRRLPTGLDPPLPAEPGTLSPVSLDLWNEGQTHVQVNTLRLENVSSGNRRTVDVNAVLAPSLPPQTVDLTSELAAFLAGAPASGPVNWDAAAGAHHIAISLEYEGSGTSAETVSKNYNIRVDGSDLIPWVVKVSRQPQA